MSTKQYLFITLFLLASCIGTWLQLTLLENREIPLNADNRPDSYMTNVTATRMNEAGRIKNQLTSPLMVHFSVNDTTHITAPHFIIYNTDLDNQPWHITANYGQAHDGITVLNLWDHVKLEQYASPQSAAITLLTTAMTIFPKQQYAQTDQPVKIWQMGSVVTSTGLHADLNTGEIDLLSQTHGKYQPDTNTGNTQK